jgi:signal transduction histidine kinase
MTWARGRLQTMLATRPHNIPEVLWWRTYAHLLYLLLGFPIALVMLVLVLLGFAFGVALAVLVVGLPILMLTVLLVWNYAAFERSLAQTLLGLEIPAPLDDLPTRTVERVRAIVGKGYFWKVTFFLLLRFLLSALAFVATLVIWAPGIAFFITPWFVPDAQISLGWASVTLLETPQRLALMLIGAGFTLIAVKITNLTAPMLGQIVCFALTDNRVLAAAQQARLEAIGLAANVATLSGSLSLSGQFEAKLHAVLEVVTAAVGANAGALLLEPKRVEVGFAPHAISALQEIGALEIGNPVWRHIPFERGTVVRPKRRNDAIWQALTIVPLSVTLPQHQARLLMRFEQSVPQQAELEFLGTVADQLSLALENSRLISVAQSKAALDERHRLARELHDSVSQALFGIALGAKTAKTLLERDPEKAREPLDYVLQLAEAGVTEMRALIFELRPEILEKEGLIAALQKQAEMMRLRYKLEMDTAFDAEPDLPLEVKQTLLRIAQEALHNTVKHAHASRARLAWQGFCLRISDNGAGFDPTVATSGLGQRTMRERAESVGAQLALQSELGQGTEIVVRLPSSHSAV